MNEPLVRRLWLAGGWPPGMLRTVDGLPLQVVYPGRSGHGAGPDLRDAILALPDGRLLHGDVELHGRTSEWRAHGHGDDPAYGHVVLHVVWRDDVGRPVERTGATEPLMTVALADVPQPVLFGRLGCPVPSQEPYHRWLRELPRPDALALLERMGDARLAAKAARVGADLHALGPAEALHRALLDALGYSQNRSPFAELAELLGAVSLRGLALEGRGQAEAERRVLTALLAASGLDDPARADGKAGESDATWRGRRMSPGSWAIVGVRPANRPHRRLAALARLAVRHRDHPLDERVLETVVHQEPRWAVQELLRLVRVGTGDGPAKWPAVVDTGWGDWRSVDYWVEHHTVGRSTPGPARALIGEQRARAILVNVLLPFALAVADGTDDAPLERAVLAAWRVAPAAGTNWVLAEMRPTVGSLPLSTARREQGAIELFRRCCEERRCLTCPSASAAELARQLAAGRTTARA